MLSQTLLLFVFSRGIIPRLVSLALGQRNQGLARLLHDLHLTYHQGYYGLPL
jgi:hypothetical protein